MERGGWIGGIYVTPSLESVSLFFQNIFKMKIVLVSNIRDFFWKSLPIRIWPHHGAFPTHSSAQSQFRPKEVTCGQVVVFALLFHVFFVVHGALFALFFFLIFRFGEPYVFVFCVLATSARDMRNVWCFSPPWNSAHRTHCNDDISGHRLTSMILCKTC